MDTFFRRNQNGVSLLETIVAVGVLGLITYFVVEMLRTGVNGQKSLQAQDDSRVLTDSMASLLTDPTACLNTFIHPHAPNSPFIYSATSPLVVPQLVDGDFKPQFSVRTAIPYWSQSPTTGLPLSGSAFVQVTWKQSGKNANDKSGPTTLFRYFIVGFTFDTGAQPISCTAITGGSGNNVNYWSMAPSGAIFNNNQNQAGNVGIGTSTPAATLDVAGSIRPGTVPTCDASSEGSIRYEMHAHELQYCSQELSWKSVSGGMRWALLNMGAQSVVKGKGIASMSSGGGNTTVTFSSPMPDTNYTVVLTPGGPGGLSAGQWFSELSAARTVNSFSFNTLNWGNTYPIGGTPPFMNVMVVP
jgi:hypothetical protein